jgi:hypothetical protein
MSQVLKYFEELFTALKGTVLRRNGRARMTVMILKEKR